jgi:2'-5' RNA ligase
MRDEAHFLVLSKVRHAHTGHLVRRMREKLALDYPGRIKIPGIKEPYVTLVPPFIAGLDQARFFNLGVQVVAKIHEQGKGGMLARMGATGFFENPDEDALYPERFNQMVEALRSEIGSISRFAYEPKGKVFTPHMTICTGHGLKRLLEKDVAVSPEGPGYPIDEPISTPELYVRIPGRSWEPFRTFMG